MRTHLHPHEMENAAAAAQHERELTRRALRAATYGIDGSIKSEVESHAEYVEAERARRAEIAHEEEQEAEKLAEHQRRTTPTPFDAYFLPERLAHLENFPGEATESEQYRIMRAARREGVLEGADEEAPVVNMEEAQRRAAAKLDLLNAELDRDAEAKKQFQLQTEGQFLGNEPMRVGFEDGAGHIIVGEAKITPAPDGGFLLTIDDGQAETCEGIGCWCGKPKAGTIEDGVISVEVGEVDEVLEGEVIDGSKPWVIGAPDYVQGYQDGVTDTHADQIAEDRIIAEKLRQDEERGYAVDTEPAPVDQGNPSAHDLVVEDMGQRKQHGLDVYGVTLQGGNGRDQLRDAYMEALDLVCYLRAALFERDGR
jgi:hypothetical protein